MEPDRATGGQAEIERLRGMLWVILQNVRNSATMTREQAVWKLQVIEAMLGRELKE